MVEVQVWTGEGEFPADLELYGSLDGAVFILLASISPTAGTAQVRGLRQPSAAVIYPQYMLT